MAVFRYAIAAVACLLPGCGEQARSADKVEVIAPAANLGLGVQTHFSQGWPPAAIDKAAEVGAVFLRDSIPWRGAERRPGVHDFRSPRIQALQTACSKGLKLVLTQVPRNPLYDGDLFVHSDAGKQAFVTFIGALLDKFGSCVIGIEVGNEINSSNFRYPEGVDGMASYVSLLALLRQQVKPRFPSVAFLGGSTNQIGTGFLQQLFAKGMLREVDGLAVHPYRSQAQAVDLEFRNLTAAMKAAGRVVPVWATEFGHDLADKDRAAGELIKMVTLMAGADVEYASWYALVDQPHFPNFGLYGKTGQKPQARAYATARKLLVSHGRPRRLPSSPTENIWQFRNGTIVAWGAGGSIELGGKPAVYDAQGNSVPSQPALPLSEAPVIIVGGSVARVAPGPVLADSLQGFGTSQWTYIARPADGRDIVLSLQNDKWTSYFGSRHTKPLRIGLASAAPAGGEGKPIKAVLRYTPSVAATLDISACLAKKPAGDGVDYTLSRNGQPVRKGVLTEKEQLTAIPLAVEAGDRVDFAFGPNGKPGSDSFGYRITIFAKGQGKQVECP